MGSQAPSKERIWKSFGENTWKEVRGLTLETSAGIQFWKTVETNPRNVDLVFHETHRALHRFEQSPNKNPAFCCCYLARIGLIFFKEFNFEQGRCFRSFKKKKTTEYKERRKFPRILCVLSWKKKDIASHLPVFKNYIRFMYSFYFLFSYKSNLCTFMTVKSYKELQCIPNLHDT